MIKFFRKEKNFAKDQESLWLNINLYWRLTVFSIFAVFIISSFFGYYLFMKIDKEYISEKNSENTEFQSVKKERIEKVLDYFSIKSKKSEKILNSPASLIDPSI